MYTFRKGARSLLPQMRIGYVIAPSDSACYCLSPLFRSTFSMGRTLAEKLRWRPPLKLSPVLQMRRSNMNHVLLDRVSLATSGTYRCEVTSKNPPRFDAKVREAKMVVLSKSASRAVFACGEAARSMRHEFILEEEE